MNTLNKQAVGVRGSSVVILLPGSRLTPDEAMMFAAYLVVNAQILDAKLPAFAEYVTAVENS